MFPNQHNRPATSCVRRIECVRQKVAEQRWCNKYGDKDGRSSGGSTLGFGSGWFSRPSSIGTTINPPGPPAPARATIGRPKGGDIPRPPCIAVASGLSASPRKPSVVGAAGGGGGSSADHGEHDKYGGLEPRPISFLGARRMHACQHTRVVTHQMVRRPRARADRLGKSLSSPAMARCKPCRKSVRTEAQAALNSRVQTLRSR